MPSLGKRASISGSRADSSAISTAQETYSLVSAAMNILCRNAGRNMFSSSFQCQVIGRVNFFHGTACNLETNQQFVVTQPFNRSTTRNTSSVTIDYSEPTQRVHGSRNHRPQYK